MDSHATSKSPQRRHPPSRSEGGKERAKKVLPPHLRGADDLDAAWSEHHQRRQMEDDRNAADAARRQRGLDEVDVPLVLGDGGWDVVGQHLGGQGWVPDHGGTRGGR
jgi:hypothetical protein